MQRRRPNQPSNKAPKCECQAPRQRARRPKRESKQRQPKQLMGRPRKGLCLLLLTLALFLVERVGLEVLNVVAKDLAHQILEWGARLLPSGPVLDAMLLRATFCLQVAAAGLAIAWMYVKRLPDRAMLTVYALANAIFYLPVVGASQPVPIAGVIGADARELSFLAMSSVLLALDARRRGDRSPPVALGMALLLGIVVAGTGEEYARLVTFGVTALGAYAAFGFGWTLRRRLSWLEKACGILYLVALVVVRPRAQYSDSLWLNQVYYTIMLLKWPVVIASLRGQRSGLEDERSHGQEPDSDRDASLRSHGTHGL